MIRRSFVIFGICGLVLVALAAYIIPVRRADDASIEAAKTLLADGNYDAAEADLRNVRWSKSRAASVTDAISAARKIDSDAWLAYDTAAQRYTRTATDPYNGAGPPRAMFDQVVGAAQAIIARPAMFSGDESNLSRNLSRGAKTMFIRYVTPTYASNSILYRVRVLQLFSCSTGWGWWSNWSPGTPCNARYGSTLIAFRPNVEGSRPVVISMGNNDAGQDASITQQIIALPWRTGFALNFSGSLPANAWGCGSCHLEPAWHVVRVDPSGHVRVDGDALPSGVSATTSAGLSATGTFTTEADADNSNRDAPFSSCMACPHIERSANMKWDGNKYAVTGATVVPTAYAAVLQYMTSQASDQFTADSANFAHLSYFRLFIKRATGGGAMCGAETDSSQVSRPKIATVQVSCSAGDQNVAFTVKAVNSSSGYKLQDAYLSTNNFDSASSDQDQ